MSTSQPKGLWTMPFSKIASCLGALNKQGVTPEQFGKLDSDPDFVREIAESFKSSGRQLSEKQELKYDYPKGFWHRQPGDQVWTHLHDPIFLDYKNIDDSHVQDLCSRKLPNASEAWAVIPKSPFMSEYGFQPYLIMNEAIRHGLVVVADIDLEKLLMRIPLSTTKSILTLKETQKGDFCVIPYQFGKRWLASNKSLFKNEDCLPSGEFILGFNHLFSLLLTHYHRLNNDENCLGVFCYGLTVDGKQIGFTRENDQLTLRPVEDHELDRFGVPTGWII